MSGNALRLDELDRIAGHPALDFVNTVHAWHDDEPGDEYLCDYDALLRWHQHADLVGPRGTRALLAGGDRAKAAALREARSFRTDLHRLFSAVARHDPLPQDALDGLSATIRKVVPWRSLRADGVEVACGWDFDGAPPSAVIGPVAWQAVELLEHGPLDRVKECPVDEGCGWLFIDVSKNRSRTWCSMKTCGNAAKVRRFRAAPRY